MKGTDVNWAVLAPSPAALTALTLYQYVWLFVRPVLV
jgi:hypothetical protein